jgi:hypothetical protein
MLSFVGYNAPFNWDTLPLTTWSSVSLVVLIYLAVIYSIEVRSMVSVFGGSCR